METSGKSERGKDKEEDNLRSNSYYFGNIRMKYERKNKGSTIQKKIADNYK